MGYNICRKESRNTQKKKKPITLGWKCSFPGCIGLSENNFITPRKRVPRCCGKLHIFGCTDYTSYNTRVFAKICFVPLVESGICLLVDLATLSTIYDVRHPLLPPGYPTQELISCPQAVRPPSSTPTLAACISDVQDLRESCDQLVPRLQEVAAV